MSGRLASNQPDVVVVEEQENNAVVIDVAILIDSNIKQNKE